ncbi:hypothetical protein [uncultured Thiodictyon sp.]|uniref:hypothetical protein n=1 Tax=uncultured Thiodictyon sp. TaxID=1846217 RepID=UPI0025ED881E|nr:hypothetical protein [uncultured Thiodictyon sp.]
MKEAEQKQLAHDSPQVCLFDLEKSILDALTGASYNCNSGSLGRLVRVPNNKRNEHHFLQLNHSIPVNLHEHDIIVLNMDFHEKSDYKENEVSLDNVTGHSIHALLSIFPEKIFNPRPYSTLAVSNEINKILNRESIVIIFASSQERVIYKEVEITSYENKITNERELTSTCFYDGFPYCHNKTGRKVKSPDKATAITPLLLKHSSDTSYGLVFDHPTHWEDHKQVKDNDFIPLLINNDGEIISFYHAYKKGAVFVFPCINDKRSFLLELFNSYLSEIFPNLFPYHSQFGWLDNGDYLLPGEFKLIEEKRIIEKRYSSEMEKNRKAIEKIKDDFSFLHDLISESGHQLVSSVEHYLKWLDFPSVINFDETNPDILEEDLQVDCGDKLLVVEIKGIGGTSTDKDCSQISKIRYRRAEQRNKFDVSGLYIVNHQRYMPPKKRNTPPFTENQIKDARLDKRGLLTTYDLYRAYFMVESGILSKDEVRDRLFDYGLVELEPKDLIRLGTPQEYFMSGTVAILNLRNINLKNGMDLFVKKNSEYEKVKILSIRINEEEVDQVTNGEIGIKLDRAARKNSEFFTKREKTGQIQL